MRTDGYGPAIAAMLLASAAVGASDCAGQAPRPIEVRGDEATRAAEAPRSADKATPDAGVFPRLASGGAVFFGHDVKQLPAIATEELLVAVRRDGSPYVRLGYEEVEGASIVAPDRIVARRLGGTLELRMYEDGSFDGAQRYEDGSQTVYERATYRPLEKELFDGHGGAPFVGFVGGTARYRVKLVLAGDGSASGVARYVMTRDEIALRGKADAQARRLELDEIAPGGAVAGHLDLVVLGHVAGPGFTGPFWMVGAWTSPDGKRREPVRLERGYYPTRAHAGGAWLSAQESYEDDCGMVHEYVWPVVDGAPGGVAAALEGRLKAMILQSPAPDPPDASEIAKLVPRSRVTENSACDPDAGVEARGTDSGVYTATPLRGARVAVDVEHYEQSGGISGNVWHDCVVVDLAKGTIREPAKLLEPTIRKALEARARVEAIRALGTVKPDDPMLAAAKALDLANVPLCIEERKVRFAYVGHRVFGPSPPEFDRDEIERMLPKGELKELLAP